MLFFKTLSWLSWWLKFFNHYLILDNQRDKNEKLKKNKFGDINYIFLYGFFNYRRLSNIQIQKYPTDNYDLGYRTIRDFTVREHVSRLELIEK